MVTHPQAGWDRRKYQSFTPKISKYFGTSPAKETLIYIIYYYNMIYLYVFIYKV